MWDVWCETLGDPVSDISPDLNLLTPVPRSRPPSVHFVPGVRIVNRCTPPVLGKTFRPFVPVPLRTSSVNTSTSPSTCSIVKVDDWTPRPSLKVRDSLDGSHRHGVKDFTQSSTLNQWSCTVLGSMTWTPCFSFLLTLFQGSSVRSVTSPDPRLGLS